MYTLVKTSSFRKSLKRFSKSIDFEEKIFKEVVNLLLEGKVLPPKFKDHDLIGSLKGYKECHLATDLLLVYERDNNLMTLTLANIGSHSYLFG